MTVSEKLRLVHGLHYHAEIFGFNWDDDSDWTWHDVACKIADEVDAENAKLREEIEAAKHDLSMFSERIVELDANNAKLRELVQELWEGYQDPPCEGCQLKDKPACADCPICAREAAVIDRMRELGVGL